MCSLFNTFKTAKRHTRFFYFKKNQASALVLKVPLILGVLVQKVSYFPDPDGGQSLRRTKTENPHG